MQSLDPIKAFVRRYMTRSVIGVSVGLAGLAQSAGARPVDGAGSATPEAAPTGSFSERLARVRAASSALYKEKPSFQMAQISNFGSFSNYNTGGDAWQDDPVVQRKTDK